MAAVVAAPAHRRAPRDLRPHPPRRPAGGRRAADWTLPARRAAAQRRLAGSRAGMRRAPGRGSPYWPGGAVVLDGDGVPRHVRLLDDVPAARLARLDGDAPTRRAAPAPARSRRRGTRRPSPASRSSTPSRAHRVRHDLVGARVLDGDGPAVDARPRRARRGPPTPRPATYGPAAGPATSAVGTTIRASGSSSGRIGATRLALDPEQLLDRELGLGVAALAEVEVEQPRGLVEEVARRPALVVVERPDAAVGVDADRVLDPQAADRGAHRGLVARGGNPGVWTEMTRSPAPA